MNIYTRQSIKNNLIPKVIKYQVPIVKIHPFLSHQSDQKEERLKATHSVYLSPPTKIKESKSKIFPGMIISHDSFQTKKNKGIKGSIQSNPPSMIFQLITILVLHK